MKKSLIYTRTGDKGMTSLVGGARVAKSHSRLEAYGTIDELNSFVGLLIAQVKDDSSCQLLRYVQHKLFSLGAYLATDQSRTRLDEAGRIDDEAVRRLEDAIDELDASLPRLSGFILPGGSGEASLCHVCRCVCRRAERRILELEMRNVCVVDENVKQFVNRLSDYFFVLARKLNELTGYNEIYWDKNCK